MHHLRVPEERNRSGALRVVEDVTDAATPEPTAPSTLPLAVLDFVGIEYGESAADSIAGAVELARAVETAGFRRYWVSEHHSMSSLACSAPEILIAHLLTLTERIRVGAAGIMLPNHSSFKVAEMFRTLLAIAPDRVDLGLGRAPGTDPLTALVLRRGTKGDPAADFPGQVSELLGFLGDGFPEGHPYSRLIAAPVVEQKPDVFMLGSSGYGPQFAAVNGMRAVFAHHMSPEIATSVLRRYRADFQPGVEQEPWSAISVLAFASEDPEEVTRFEAGWALTMLNLRRNIREPIRPEAVDAFAASSEFRDTPRDPDRMAIGPAEQVVERLQELQRESQSDEVVIVTPGLDRAARIASFEAIAAAWPR
ncbi:LLM class flavin-dependent oxidoreductase [Pseudactinotalea terrae]|uniref:LLM class flavin-dependent oxidoreductase n=1 Tax=Pseudactinotalea terrae TaxID=1743262 RepID=UPI0012E1649D|nr:LLM class flavin-dependent oxidoreductase [Pseudactinotalea terrae]